MLDEVQEAARESRANLFLEQNAFHSCYSTAGPKLTFGKGI